MTEWAEICNRLKAIERAGREFGYLTRNASQADRANALRKLLDLLAKDPEWTGAAFSAVAEGARGG